MGVLRRLQAVSDLLNSFLRIIMNLTCARWRKDVCLLSDWTNRLTAFNEKDRKIITLREIYEPFRLKIMKSY